MKQSEKVNPIPKEFYIPIDQYYGFKVRRVENDGNVWFCATLIPSIVNDIRKNDEIFCGHEITAKDLPSLVDKLSGYVNLLNNERKLTTYPGFVILYSRKIITGSTPCFPLLSDTALRGTIP